MNREQIEQWAREAGALMRNREQCFAYRELEAFARLVAVWQREQDAKILESHPSYDFCRCPCECATAIRKGE